MPHKFADMLFLASLFIPAAMYLFGLLCLLVSLLGKHRRATAGHVHTVEAIAH